MGRPETPGVWPSLLITRRSQVQILPPLPTSSQVRGPFPLGEGLLHVWPVTRSVTRLLASDVSSVPLCLRRNAELRFVGHIAMGGTPGTRSPGRNPAVAPRSWQSGPLSATFHLSARLELTAASSCLCHLRAGTVAAR